MKGGRRRGEEERGGEGRRGEEERGGGEGRRRGEEERGGGEGRRRGEEGGLSGSYSGEMVLYTKSHQLNNYLQDGSLHLHSEDQGFLSQGPGRDQYHGMGDPEHAGTIT